jgi:hypothetical protein
MCFACGALPTPMLGSKVSSRLSPSMRVLFFVHAHLSNGVYFLHICVACASGCSPKAPTQFDLNASCGDGKCAEHQPWCTMHVCHLSLAPLQPVEQALWRSHVSR